LGEGVPQYFHHFYKNIFHKIYKALKMKQLMQKISLTILFATLVFTSCKESFFEVKPQGKLTGGNFFETEEHAVLATNAVYNILRNWQVHVFAYVGCTDIISDDADKGSEPNDALFILDMDNLAFDAGNVAPLTVWQGYYRGILRANTAIERIPSIKMKEDLKSRLIGESKFLRAHFYFNLVRWFGDVPLITRSLTKDEFKQPRAPIADVYKQIIQDLTDAATVLPKKSAYPSEDLGRATKGAAQGLLSKVYLTIKDYLNAEKWATEVINSNEYSLFPDFAKIFTRVGENSSESLFEVQATSSDERVTFSADFDGGSQYGEVQGVRGTPNLGWGFNRPSDELIRSFEPGDPRRDATILYEGEVLPDGSAIVEKNDKIFNARFNQKAWMPKPAGTFNYNSPLNIRILRYADVMLIAAEAQNENGKTAVALKNLNAIRERARGGLTTVLPDVTETNKDKLRTAIWQERHVELALEQHRWFDLLRTGQAETALKAHKKNFVKNKHELLPIPQEEIDLSAGSLKQNQGY
jgi:starch-binding outer membrane protein, SusD/RagB family